MNTVSSSRPLVDLAESFKAYDVRGIVGETITVDSVRAVGAAFVDVLGLAGQKVLVGGDMRPSSPEFMAAFAQGAQARGGNVVTLGLISTDMLYYASGVLDAAGVVFTASHNPAAYNGMKMSRAGAVPVSSDSGLFEMRDVAQSYLESGTIPAVDTPGTLVEDDVLAGYAQYLRSLVDLSGIRRLKLVVDAGNGMAGKTTPAVLGDAVLSEQLPLDIVPLYFELDGTFPNHPANPLEPANLVDLQKAVREHGADMGLAFDGDADRCFVIDENGDPVSPSAVTGLVARREIARAKAGSTVNGVVHAPEEMPTIIYNLITSRAVPELVEAEGGRAVETRVGHSFIKALMAQEGAVFGGEHSAHYYFRDFFNADTGMLAAMHVLAALGEQDLPLSALAAEYNPYFASGEINSEVDDKDGAIADVLEQFANGWSTSSLHGTVCEACVPALGGQHTTVTQMDGTTVTAADGTWWFNLRPSNTEPFLRYNGEAHDEATMVQVRDAVLSIVRNDASTGF